MIQYYMGASTSDYRAMISIHTSTHSASHISVGCKFDKIKFIMYPTHCWVGTFNAHIKKYHANPHLLISNTWQGGLTIEKWPNSFAIHTVTKKWEPPEVSPQNHSLLDYVTMSSAGSHTAYGWLPKLFRKHNSADKPPLVSSHPCLQAAACRWT